MDARRIEPISRLRVAVLAISTGVALAILVIGLRWIRGRQAQPIGLRIATAPASPRATPVAALSELPGERLAPRTPEEWVFHLPLAQASSIFAIESGVTDYDPWCCARRVPNYDWSMPWPEHPRGLVRFTTNSLGLREDRELPATPAELRVLVVGDSHADGVCENSESFANLLELQLAQRTGRTTEVLNAANGGHSFLNYFGTWLRFREFRPQVLVVAVFGGNDFSGLMLPFLWLTGRACPPSSEWRDAQRLAAIELAPALVAQGIEQVETTRSFPRFLNEMALNAAWLCGEIGRSARAAGTELVVLYIPSPFEVTRLGQRPGEREVCELLDLKPRISRPPKP